MLFCPDDSILRELTELHVVVTQESMPETKKTAAYLTFNQKHGTCLKKEGGI